eukprot:Selendium_serpulae@DN1258_c0_g1_i1.p2
MIKCPWPGSRLMTNTPTLRMPTLGGSRRLHLTIVGRGTVGLKQTIEVGKYLFDTSLFDFWKWEQHCLARSRFVRAVVFAENDRSSIPTHSTKNISCLPMQCLLGRPSASTAPSERHFFL